MEYEEAFGDDVEPREFYLEKLPDLHRDRLDVFRTYAEEPLRFSIRLTDVDEQYSIEFTPDGARAREGEFIDFPVATFETTTDCWDLVKAHTPGLARRAEERLRADPPDARIDRAFLDDLERHDGVLDVSLHFEEAGRTLDATVILNDYEPPPGARRVEVDFPLSLVESLVDGRIPAEEAARSADIAADLGLAFDLAGLAAEHFPELGG